MLDQCRRRRGFLHMATSRQKEAQSQDYALLLSKYLNGSLIVHNDIDSTAHSWPLNRLDHHIQKDRRTEGSPKSGLCPTPIEILKWFFNSAQWHRQHCTLLAFKQFGSPYTSMTTSDTFAAVPAYYHSYRGVCWNQLQCTPGTLELERV